MKRINEKFGMSQSSTAIKFMGITAALAFTLVSFEWKSFDDNRIIYDHDEYLELPSEPVLITYPSKKKIKKIITNKKVLTEKKNATETFADFVTTQKTVVRFELNTDSMPTVDPIDEFIDERPIVKPFTHPHVKAEFPGGDQALFDFLGKEIRYPDDAMAVGIEGLVHIQFVVRKDGTIDGVEIKHGIGGGCEEEAVRAILSSPLWKPGKVDGNPVDSYFNLPVRFGMK